MKKALIALVLAAVAQTASAAVAGTKHDLTLKITNEPDSQTCVYCHTPHGSNITVAGAPLWNRTNNTGYTMYPQANVLGAVGATPGINSLTCLSCHDGTSDMGVVYNGGVDRSIGVNSSMGATIYNVGKDLTNDHPVAIAYNVAAGLNTIASVNAVLKLYGATSTVECGSCHEPHSTTNSFFLRASANASLICTTCHIK